jgi:hypothetical protein
MIGIEDAKTHKVVARCKDVVAARKQRDEMNKGDERYILVNLDKRKKANEIRSSF